MYSRNFWKDHITDAQGQIIQQGTLVNQTNLNNIEAGIFEAQTTQNLNAIINRLQADEAANNTQIVISLVATTTELLSVEIPANLIRKATNYTVAPVITAISGATSAPVIIISAKQANGFKVQLTGTFTSVTLSLLVQGGIL